MGKDAGGSRQARKVVVAYRAAALVVFVMSLAWALIFSVSGHHAMARAELFPAAVAILCFILIEAGRLELVLKVTQIACFVSIVYFCLLFDTPDPAYPRVTHLFLPLLAILAYLDHIRRPSRFQLAIIAASVIAFVVLHVSAYAPPFAEPIPHELRRVGIWVNATLATATFCSAVWLLQRRLTAPKGLARDLLAALQRDELTLAYQPQADRDGRIVGAEALLRWTHPVRGTVSPATFIPVAEEAGLMPLVGGLVLEEACRTLARWSADPALERLTLSINVSAGQFNESDFVASVRSTIRAHRIDPARLRLELTESVLIAGLDAVAAKMEELRALGLSFSLDDFGTGYSSLSYLRRLPVCELKIDRSFVAGAADDGRDAALLRSIIAMARDLDLSIVAEGVETQPQWTALKRFGCDVFQGWLIGRPGPAADLEAAVCKQGLPEPLALQSRIRMATAKPATR
ncbi:EAL domain-containing protein [Ciceribacter sp. L1K22]|uniref:putative bifunctional diguanylate cyclase/phosphodiesterase n=1 Tax=Ciceribacter sp. L1K22 TaxID=2820275 RepID=UPI001ABED4FD|nr:EAL domain-containing protein [Ciceribacter sp. L1K22]MBO3761078.1 EAL domain-containing protein [Ciceribacter sp. L1K22]